MRHIKTVAAMATLALLLTAFGSLPSAFSSTHERVERGWVAATVPSTAIPAFGDKRSYPEISDVAASHGGGFAFVWRQLPNFRQGLFFREGTADNRWGPIKVFDPGVGGYPAQVEAAADGTWVVAWCGVNSRDRNGYSIKVATKTRKGSWQRRTLSLESGRPHVFTLTTNPSGDVELLYTTERYSASTDTSEYALTSATRGTDGKWTKHPRLEVPIAFLAGGYSPLALAGDGRASVVEVDDETVARVFDRASNGVWSETAQLQLTTKYGLRGIRPTAGPNNSLTLFWEGGEAVDSPLYYLDRQPDGTWSESSIVPGAPTRATRLTDGGRLNIWPGRDGTVALTWVDRAGLHWLYRTAAGDWLPGVVIGPRSAYLPNATQLTNGEWLITYGAGHTVRTRVRTVSGNWRAAQTVTREDTSGVSYPSLKGGYMTWWRTQQLKVVRGVLHR